MSDDKRFIRNGVNESFVVKRKETGEVMGEFFNHKLIPWLKPEFEAIPITDYLQDLNCNISQTQQPIERTN